MVLADPDYDPKQAKKLEKELKKFEDKKEEGGGDDKKKHTLKGAAKAVNLASKLSPKSQRKKKITANIAQLKVKTCDSLVVVKIAHWALTHILKALVKMTIIFSLLFSLL